jgi:hypothetical protein
MPSGIWKPTRFERFEASIPTSSECAIVLTDQGRAYAKFMRKSEAPHGLACELIGTSLADALGLKTLDWSVMMATPDDDYELCTSGHIIPGPAFVTRESFGASWDGTEQTLAHVQNPEDIPLLVLLDTWILNCDRYHPTTAHTRCNRDNVWLEKSEAASPLLVAYDHTHCLSCGHPLTSALQVIDRVKCDDIFGRFPEFDAFVTRDNIKAALERLARIGDDRIKAIVSSVPRQWGIDTATRDAISKLLVQRKQFLFHAFLSKMFPQEEFGL